MNRTVYTLAAVLALAIGGCRNVTGPQVPQPPQAPQYPQPGTIRAVRVDAKHGAIRFKITAPGMRGYHWHIELNTDNNASTGYGNGSEYYIVWPGLDGESVTILRCSGDDWPIVGEAEFSVSRSTLDVRIPREAIGGAESMGWSVWLIDAASGEMVDYARGQLEAHALALAQ